MGSAIGAQVASSTRPAMLRQVPRLTPPATSAVLTAVALVAATLLATPVDAAAETDGVSEAVSVVSVDYTEGEGCMDFPELCTEVDGELVPRHAGQWELNLSIPAGCPEPLPVFIDNPGSAWSSTDTNGTSHAMTDFCYAFAGVNDTSSSLCTFPCQTWDMNAAIRWLRANAEGWTRPDDHTASETGPAGESFQYRLDPDRIAVSGFSSGGWQAAFEGTTNGEAFEWELPDGHTHTVDLEGILGPWEGIYSSDVQAVIPLHPPTDFSLMNPPYSGLGPPSALDHDGASSPESNMVGCTVGTSRDDDHPLYTYDPLCEAKVQSANPIHYVSHDDPPQMVFHGSSDSLVPHGQSVYLYDALRASCNDVRFYSMDGHNHVPIYMGLDPSSPYAYFEQVNCGQQVVGHGPPELFWEHSANWAGVAGFLDAHMRETTPPDLHVDASGNPGTAEELRAHGAVAVEVRTEEASWYDVVLLVDGEQVGTASVDIYDWGAEYPAGTPAPYTTTIEVPVTDRGPVSRGSEVTVEVTARDRVANEVTRSESFTLT